MTNPNIITVQGERIILDKDRHIRELEAELAAVKDPWIYIDEGDEGTLPEDSIKNLLLSILNERPGEQPHKSVTKAWYNHGRWMVVDRDTGYIEPIEDVAAKSNLRVTPYAYQPWPDPAPQKETP
jgi:hypothetical protein